MTTSYTITCSSPSNYGAILQTYGLNQTLIDRFGLDAGVIDYNPLKYHDRKFRTSPAARLKQAVRYVLRTPDRIRNRNSFGNFVKTNIPMSSKTYYSPDQLQQDPPLADLYIAGSDQIWNSLSEVNGRDDSYFLTFAPSNAKKISYAASLAMPYIPEDQKDRYYKLISEFDAVSVREPSAIPLLENIGIKNVQAVVDPALLLPREGWDRVAKTSSFIPEEKYVLIYGYDRQKDVYSYANALADSLHMKVYTVGTAIEDFTLRQDRYFWDKSPATFVKLFQNASAVVTNSFHGTVFSIIYNVPLHFFPVNRTTNSRMLDLLESTRLLDRQVKGNNLLSNSNIDFKQVNSSVEANRNRSIDFLQNAIN